jgi:peptidoglycan/LPS O-acetylase OafA/YrhL
MAASSEKEMRVSAQTVLEKVIDSSSDRCLKPGLVHSLTGLRLWAALAVFISHLYHFNYFGISDLTITTILGALGHLGVSVFYVLSGFVLYLNYGPSYLQNHKLEPKTFYWARFARVYPVYFVTTLLAVPPELLSPHKTGFVQALLLNLGLMQCLGADACGRMNDVGWSVGVEAVFYALFPFFLMQFRSNAKMVTMWLLLFGIDLLLPFAFPEGFYGTNRFPGTRLTEFFTGLVIAHAYWKGWLQLPSMMHNPQIRSAAIFLLCGLLILQPVFLPSWLGRYDNLFYIPATGCLILLLALSEKQQYSLTGFTSAWAVLGGEISYSFYLVHNLLLRYLEHGARHLLNFDIKIADLICQIPLALVALLLSILAAYWMYQCIEKPMRDKLRSLKPLSR